MLNYISFSFYSIIKMMLSQIYGFLWHVKNKYKKIKVINKNL